MSSSSLSIANDSSVYGTSYGATSEEKESPASSFFSAKEAPSLSVSDGKASQSRTFSCRSKSLGSETDWKCNSCGKVIFSQSYPVDQEDFLGERVHCCKNIRLEIDFSTEKSASEQKKDWEGTASCDSEDSSEDIIGLFNGLRVSKPIRFKLKAS